MKKPLWREALDQTAHFSVALIVALIATFAATVGAFICTGTLIGMALGFVREITEGGNVFSDGSIRDLTFWTLGGFTAGLLFTVLL